MHVTDRGVDEDPSALPPPGAEPTSEQAPWVPARPEIVALGVVALVVGVVLRFVTLSALWLDEALSVNIAALPVGEIGSWLRHDGHPPLYYYLLHGWMELFGTSDFAVRALSGVFGVLALPLAWLVGRRRGGPTLAWIVTAVVALSPFAVRYSTETRMYSMIMMLVLAGYLLADDVLRRGRSDLLRLAGIAVITALLLYTHYWAIYLLAATGLVVLWKVWKAPDPTARRVALKVVGALVVGGVLFLPWLPSMLYQSSHTGTPWADPIRPTAAIPITLADFGAGIYTDAGLVGTLLAIAILLAVFGRGVDRRHIDVDLGTRPQLRVEAIVVALTFLIGSAAGFVSSSAYATRYASVYFPFVALLVAGGLTRFLGRWVRFGVVVVLCGALVVGALSNVRDGRTQARQIADAIDEVAQPGDIVVYCPDQLGPGVSRELDADVEQVVFPTFARPERVDWVDYGDRNENADTDAFSREVLERAGASSGVFLVWNGDYKTLTDACPAVVDFLARSRPAQEIVADGGARFFEHASVLYFAPVG